MNDIWEKVKQHQGEAFCTVTGLEFTYRVVGKRSFIRAAKQPYPDPTLKNPYS